MLALLLTLTACAGTPVDPANTGTTNNNNGTGTGPRCQTSRTAEAAGAATDLRVVCP